jgi:hypothetical protein
VKTAVPELLTAVYRRPTLRLIISLIAVRDYVLACGHGMDRRILTRRNRGIEVSLFYFPFDTTRI